MGNPRGDHISLDFDIRDRWAHWLSVVWFNRVGSLSNQIDIFELLNYLIYYSQECEFFWDKKQTNVCIGDICHGVRLEITVSISI